MGHESQEIPIDPKDWDLAVSEILVPGSQSHCPSLVLARFKELLQFYSDHRLTKNLCH